jgi:plastocyanin
MKRLALIYIFTALASILPGLTGCKSDSASAPYGSGGTPPAHPAPNTFVMQPMSFSPSSMTVAIGTTVTWKNSDGIAHTSTSDTPGLWDTGNMAPGTSATTTFNTAGTFAFHCRYHAAMGMTGTITVR